MDYCHFNYSPALVQFSFFSSNKFWHIFKLGSSVINCNYCNLNKFNSILNLRTLNCETFPSFFIPLNSYNLLIEFNSLWTTEEFNLLYFSSSPSNVDLKEICKTNKKSFSKQKASKRSGPIGNVDGWLCLWRANSRVLLKWQINSTQS